MINKNIEIIGYIKCVDVVMVLLNKNVFINIGYYLLLLEEFLLGYIDRSGCFMLFCLIGLCISRSS